MSIQTRSQLEVSQAKLGFLRGACNSLRQQTGGDAHVNQLALQSLLSQIKELEREIALYEKSSGRHAVVR